MTDWNPFDEGISSVKNFIEIFFCPMKIFCCEGLNARENTHTHCWPILDRACASNVPSAKCAPRSGQEWRSSVRMRAKRSQGVWLRRWWLSVSVTLSRTDRDDDNDDVQLPSYQLVITFFFLSVSTCINRIRSIHHVVHCVSGNLLYTYKYTTRVWKETQRSRKRSENQAFREEERRERERKRDYGDY